MRRHDPYPRRRGHSHGTTRRKNELRPLATVSLPREARGI